MSCPNSSTSACSARPPHILGSGSQVRHYTNGRDVERGIRMAMESEQVV